MHDITLHFGDLSKSWARLNPTERGIAFNLLCHYYDKEQALPGDDERLFDAAGIEPASDDKKTKGRRAEQIEALRTVLRRHYVLVDGRYRHERCEREIRKYRHRCLINAYNNLAKIAKKNPALQVPTFDLFEANFEFYYDAELKRFRNLAVDSPKPPNGKTSQTEALPKSSDSEKIAVPKNPIPGSPTSHFPLPTSLLPCSQESPPTPQGDASHRSDSLTLSSDDQTTSSSPPSELTLPGSPASPPEQKKGRARNPLMDTLAELSGWDVNAVTGSSWGRIAAALKDIRSVEPEVTPERLREVARRYCAQWPDIDLTPTALAANWARFAGPKKEGGGGAAVVANAEPENWLEGWAALFDEEPPEKLSHADDSSQIAVRRWCNANPASPQ